MKDAKKYFKNQTKETKYIPMIRKTDKPPIELNEKIMSTYRPEMKKYYYDESKYDSYLDQLGIKFPTMSFILTFCQCIMSRITTTKH